MANRISDSTKRLLQSRVAGERQLAVKKLRYSKSNEARQLLSERIKVEQEPEVLEWLCRGLQATLASDAIAPLITATAHPVGDVRAAACESLGVLADEPALERLKQVALTDSDHHVRLASIEALETYGKRHRDERVAVTLRKIAAELSFERDNAGLRDIGQAAKLAAKKVEEFCAPTMLTLFDVEFAPIEMTESSKTRTIERLEQFLKARGGVPEQIQYVVSLVRSIKRNGALVTRRKNEGVTHCEICVTPFFVQKSGSLYCQVAHIQALKDKGRDAVENTLLLCGNCHAQLDMARDTIVTHTGDKLQIQLPDGNTATFLVSGGHAPRKI